MTNDEQFAAYLEQDEVCFQRCDECGTLRGNTRTVCPACLSHRGTWVPAAERGVILSFIVAHEQFATEIATPYVVAHVELDDGVRYTAGLSGDDFDIGARVRICTRELDGRLLPHFTIDD